MPFSGTAPNKTFTRGSGVYTGSTTWQQTESAARGIRSDDHDTHDQDIAAAVNTSLQKNGDNKPTADIDWGGYKITNLADAAGDQHAMNRRSVWPTALAKTADYTVTTSERGKLVTGDATSAAITFTLPAAATAGDGFEVTLVKIDSSSNTVTIDGNASETINGATTLVLARQWDGVKIRSNGTGWNVLARVGEADSAIVTAMIAANAVTNAKLAQMTQSTFKGRAAGAGTGDPVDLTATQATAILDAASDTLKGTIEIADQSEMEAATDTTRAVVPGRVNFHPGVAKCWLKATYSGGTPSIAASHNITSLTDTATGRLTVTIATDFSSANYAYSVTAEESSVGNKIVAFVRGASIAAGSIEIDASTTGGSFDDPASISFIGFGDQS